MGFEGSEIPSEYRTSLQFNEIFIEQSFPENLLKFLKFYFDAILLTNASYHITSLLGFKLCGFFSLKKNPKYLLILGTIYLKLVSDSIFSWLLFASIRLKTPLRNKKHIFKIVISYPRHKEEDSLQRTTVMVKNQYKLDTIGLDYILSHRNHNIASYGLAKRLNIPPHLNVWHSVHTVLILGVQHTAYSWASCSALFFCKSMLKWSLQMLNK